MTKEEQILVGIEELVKQLNDVKKLTRRTDEKEDEVTTSICNRLQGIEESLSSIHKRNSTIDLQLDKIKISLDNTYATLSSKRSQVLHRYLEVKQPHWWIVGIASYFLVSLFTIFVLLIQAKDYKAELANTRPNDIKYRLLKIQNEPLSKFRNVATNTTQLTYFIDSYYESDPTAVEEFVIKREEQVRKAFEAAELARQKEIEAKAAREEAERLKRRD